MSAECPGTQSGRHLYLAGRCIGCPAANRATAPGPHRFTDDGPPVPAPANVGTPLTWEGDQA